MSYYQKFNKRMALYTSLMPWPTALVGLTAIPFLLMTHSFMAAVSILLLALVVCYFTLRLCNTLFLGGAIAYRDKLLATVPHDARPDDAQQSWLRQSAFLLLLHRHGYMIGAGTAFAWDAYTLVTCAHCVPDNSSMLIVSHADGRHLSVQSVYKHPGLDLAFIRLRQPHDYPVLLRREEPLATDDPVWTLDLRYQGDKGALANFFALTGAVPQRLNARYPVHVGYYHPPEAFVLSDVGKIRSDVALMPVYGGMSGSPLMHGSHAVGMLFAGGPFMSAFVPMRLIAKAAASLPPHP